MTTETLRKWLVKKIKEVKGREVTIEEEPLYESALYYLVEKGRDTHQKKSIIAEKEHSFTNTDSDQETTFQIRSSYEESTSLVVVTENRRSITVGGGVSGGFSGNSASISAKYQTGWRKKTSEGERQVEVKELSHSGQVKPEHRVRVKEITYALSSSTKGKLDIVLGENTKIHYKYSDGCKSKRSITVKKLLKGIAPVTKPFEWTLEGLTVHMQVEWVYKTVTHNLEVYSEKLPEQYREQVRELYGASPVPPPEDTSDADQTQRSGAEQRLLRSSHWTQNQIERGSGHFELHPIDRRDSRN
jgi:hypothetical protein